MIKLLTNLDADALVKELNNLGPSAQIVAIYSLNLLHHAWVKIGEPKETKAKSKGTN
jgi:hypothetical protein